MFKHFNLKDFINEAILNRKPNKKQITLLKDSGYKVLGGYHIIKYNVKGIIATTKDDINTFFMINDEKRMVVYPCMEISDETLNGFNQAKDGEDFIGKGKNKMKRMTIEEVKQYSDYSVSYDPNDIPNGW